MGTNDDQFLGANRGRRPLRSRDVLPRSIDARTALVGKNDEPPVGAVVISIVEQDITTGGPGQTLDIYFKVDALEALIAQLPAFIEQARRDAEAAQKGPQN